MLRNSKKAARIAALGTSSILLGMVGAGVPTAAAQDGAAVAPDANSSGDSSSSSDDDSSSGSGVEKGTFGIGLMIGLPTGIAAKLYLEDDRAVQGAFGVNLVSEGIHVHADYVFHPYILQDKEEFTMPVYAGPGARLVQYRKGRDGDNYMALGARGVVGMMFDFKNIPLDAFLEAAFVLEYGFADDEGFGVTLDVGGGARYYF